MDHRLRQVAQIGDINLFYDILDTDHRILDKIDAKTFVETPLHVSATLGHISFSMEMMRLKPAFVRKPNLDGFTPIHLALKQENPKCNHLVQAFVCIEPDLVRVKGRGGVTPLHYVAELGNNADLLFKFLVACPDSIKDVTVGNESVLHTALKDGTNRSFDVLLGWLKRGLYDDRDGMKKTLLNLQDNDGNTVLHIAVSNNRSHVVMELLKNKVNVNLKNIEGCTPLDINGQLASSPANKMINDMLLGAGALGADAVNARPTDVEKLTSIVSWIELKSISFFRRTFFMPVNKSNMLLVVAILVVTTTYQTGLAPPGGVWQDDTSSASRNNTITTNRLNSKIIKSADSPHHVGDSVLSPPSFFYFSFLNTTAFCLSTAIIFLLLPSGLSGGLLRVALVVLYLCYITSVHFISIGVVSMGIYIGLSVLGLCLALGFYFFRNLCTLVIPIGLKEF